jgi:hypothetical protein
MGAARLLGPDAAALGRRMLQMLLLIGVQALALFVGAGTLA